MPDIAVGSRVVITNHDTWRGEVGVVYHLEREIVGATVSVALDHGYDAIELPLDSVEHLDSEPVNNPAWDDLTRNRSGHSK